MRKLFKELFYVPKYGKVREKVMLTHVTMSIVIIVACLAAMSLSAYAYFSYNVTSDANIIKAANFEADVSISIVENDNSIAVEVTKEKNASYTADLQAGKTYTVTLRESDSSTAVTGFCAVSAIDCPDTYHSLQIDTDTSAESGIADKVTFQLSVTADTTVTFTSCWGTSSYYADYSEKGKDDRLYITNADIGDRKVVMIINGIAEAGNSADKETTNTTAATDDTATTEPTAAPTEERVTTPAAEAIQPIETTAPETTGTSEPTAVTAPSVSITGSAATETTDATAAATETTDATTAATETTDATTATTEPTDATTAAPTDTSDPATASASDETTDPTESEQSLPATENTENTGAPTTEASE